MSYFSSLCSSCGHSSDKLLLADIFMPVLFLAYLLVFLRIVSLGLRESREPFFVRVYVSVSLLLALKPMSVHSDSDDVKEKPYRPMTCGCISMRGFAIHQAIAFLGTFAPLLAFWGLSMMQIGQCVD